MKSKILIILLYFTLIEAQQIILPVFDNFELIVKVSVKDSQNRYIYEYSLKNSEQSGQPVRYFKIPNFSPAYPYKDGDTVLAPQNWKGGATLKWKEGQIIRRIIARWTASQSFELIPGDSLNGFVFVTKELPDISYWYAEGKDTIVFPEVYGLPEDVAEDTLEKIFEGKTPYGPGKTGKTVGPGPYPPMKSSWPWGHYPDSAFIHLRDILSKCKQEGWVSQHAYDQIWRITGSAWNHLENGRLEQSKRTLTRLMKTLERFKEKGDITPEAFYILYYRTRYVRDNLWYNP